jgi:hypothetical protein
VIVHFVDIGGIVDHHSLCFLFIIVYLETRKNALLVLFQTFPLEPEDSILTATLKQFSSYLDDVSICVCNTYKSFVSRI